MVLFFGGVMKSYENVVVLQSFRNYDVPDWIKICRKSVRQFASERGYGYEFMGDEFFDFAPPWIREIYAQNIWSLSDICRLEWIKKCLGEKADTVIWADIDILIFDQRHMLLNLEKSYGFSYELCFSEKGFYHGLNNAFMFFRRGSDMLDHYLTLCYERVKMDAYKTVRTGIGPDLLRNMNIDDTHIIHGITIFNIAMMLTMFNDPDKRIPYFITNKLKSAVGAANLCLNERQVFSEEERHKYDFVVEEVSRALIDKS